MVSRGARVDPPSCHDDTSGRVALAECLHESFEQAPNNDAEKHQTSCTIVINIGRNEEPYDFKCS